MPRLVCQTALSLLMLGLATCGPPSADEPPPPVEEWLVGEWFLGDWGDMHDELSAIDWTRVDADGTWTYGHRGCNGEVMLFGGTWRELEPGVAEFTADNEIDILPFTSYLATTAQMRFQDECGRAEVVYLNEKNEQFDEPKFVTRGMACLDGCSEPFPRVAVPCPGTEDPCAGQ